MLICGCAKEYVNRCLYFTLQRKSTATATNARRALSPPGKIYYLTVYGYSQSSERQL